MSVFVLLILLTGFSFERAEPLYVARAVMDVDIWPDRLSAEWFAGNMDRMDAIKIVAGESFGDERHMPWEWRYDERTHVEQVKAVLGHAWAFRRGYVDEYGSLTALGKRVLGGQ